MANIILSSTKELLGVPADVTDFDNQLVNYINMALHSLYQTGVGTGVSQITLTTGDFDSILPGEDSIHSTLQMYIYMKVRLLFDPPTSSFVLSSLESQIKELEWRLQDYSAVEPIV